MYAGSTTLGGYRLGLVLLNAEQRCPRRTTQPPTVPPAPVWRWEVRRLGTTLTAASMAVAPGDDPAAAVVVAQAMRMLQAAAMRP